MTQDEALVLVGAAGWLCNLALAGSLFKSRSPDIALIAACAPPAAILIVALGLISRGAQKDTNQ